MAVIRNPDISDDEFDLIDPEPVSDMSDLESAAHGKTKLSPPNVPQRTASSKSTGRPARSTSNRASRDTANQAAPVPRDATGSEAQQGTYASTFGTNKPNADAGHSGEGIPGLKYTKSMYQKLWGSKDALIAVMG